MNNLVQPFLRVPHIVLKVPWVPVLEQQRRVTVVGTARGCVRITAYDGLAVG